MAALMAFAIVYGFYAATELRRFGPPHPDRPLAVVRGGRAFDLSPDLGMRDIGPGLARANLIELCPGLRLVPYEPEHYREPWERVLDICAGLVPAVEPLASAAHGMAGVPEFPQAFLDVTGLDAPSVCSRLGREIRAETGATACFGLGPTKLSARAAGLELLRRRGKGKTLGPGDFLVCPLEEGPGGEERPARSFIAPLPVAYLYPFPAEVPARLRKLGFRTFGEVSGLSAAELGRHFDRDVARRIVLAASGGETEAVGRGWPPPAFEVVRRFPGGLVGREALETAVGEAAAHLSREMRDRGLGCREVTVVLESESGRRSEASRRLPLSGRSRDTLFFTILDLASGLIRAWAPAPEAGPETVADPPISLGIRAGRMISRPAVQLDFGLSREDASRSPGAVADIAQGLSLRFGGGAIRKAGEVAPSLSRREDLLAFYDPLRRHVQAH